VLQQLELGRLETSILISLQSVLEHTIGKEELERRNDALDRRVLEKLGATYLSEKKKIITKNKIRNRIFFLKKKKK
jgi:hypothetical protein